LLTDLLDLWAILKNLQIFSCKHEYGTLSFFPNENKFISFVYVFDEIWVDEFPKAFENNYETRIVIEEMILDRSYATTKYYSKPQPLTFNNRIQHAGVQMG